jgi:hypothetical protein
MHSRCITYLIANILDYSASDVTIEAEADTHILIQHSILEHARKHALGKVNPTPYSKAN